MPGTKVLVTGADGFIGSHLTEQLVAGGMDVRALSLYNSFNTWGWLDSLGCLDAVEVVTGDVRDPNFCRQIMKGVDVVYHLAALIAIPYSYTAPDSYVDTNIKGTLNICQAARDSGCRRVVHTSTSEVYGTARSVPISEAHPLQPQSPYSASKIGADMMAMSFHHAFGLPVVVARPFNTYGPRQSARAVIPTIITQIAAGRREIRLGDVSPTRDFNYVLDTCRGLMALGECDAALGQVVNIGSGTEISIHDVLLLIRELMQSSVEFITEQDRVRPADSEVFRLCCDNSRLVDLTGYSPAYSLRRGLEATIAWFSCPEHLARYKVDIYNV